MDDKKDRSESKPVVLFLCTGNSARSQMAEAFLKEYAGSHFEAHSAGVEPTILHPMTVQVMKEVGIDISGCEAKSVRPFLGKLGVRLVIFVCEAAGKHCPVTWPGAVTRLSWPFEHPVVSEATPEEQLAKFRTVRDQIDQRIKNWLKELEVGAFSPRGGEP